jgi:hypothetical protein
MILIVLMWLILLPLPAAAQTDSTRAQIELLPIEVDPKDGERKNFGSLILLSAFELISQDKRFGGLSGLSIGSDGRLYAVSDQGHWFSARMETGGNGALAKLIDWRIAPLLAPNGSPVSGAWRDAEALARAPDGSFLVAFEGRHRIWRYDAPPKTFQSLPLPVAAPPAIHRAPGNGGIEALTVLPDGTLLIILEELANADRSVKGWLIDNDRFGEFSYVPAAGFRVTDCAALQNGDLLVLERRYVPFGILSARLTLVPRAAIRPGAKLAGKELLKLEQPLAVENFEAIAVQETARGAVIFVVSDDNFSSFQQTLLLQFLLPNTGN